MWLFLIFVSVPIIEIALFIKVGGFIGLWPTLAIVVLTALIGTVLMRIQGMATLARLQQSLAEGSNPAGPLAHGALILVAGVLLLTPGFFTDTVGLALLVPPVRDLVIRWGAAKAAARVSVFSSVRTGGMQTSMQEDVIEVDYEDVSGDAPRRGPSGGSSGWTRPSDS